MDDHDDTDIGTADVVHVVRLVPPSCDSRRCRREPKVEQTTEHNAVNGNNGIIHEYS